MNSTYHSAIKAIPYEVVFNRKPNYKRVDQGFRPMIMEADIEEHLIKDEQDDKLIAAEQPQLAAETCLREEINVAEVDMTATVASSELTSLDPYETLSEYVGSLPGDPINLESITQYLNSVDKYKSGKRSQVEPVTPSELILDPELQSLSPHMESLQLNPASIAAASQVSTAFRDRIHENQLHANERFIRQFGKQNAVRSFKIGEAVSVAVPELDRASKDDKRVFGQVIRIYSGLSYKIQTKYRILDRNFLTSELMPLPSTMDLGIPIPAPDQKIILHAVAVCESTTDKIPVFCKCKDERSWCSTRRCACVKADVKCGIACHGRGDNDNAECSNLDIPHLRSQKSLRVRDRDDEGESSKRQRRGTAGKSAK